MADSELTRETTLGAAADGFRFRAGDAVMHRSAESAPPGSLPTKMIVICPWVEMATGAFTRCYFVRSTGCTGDLATCWFGEFELAPYPDLALPPWAERVVDLFRKEPTPAA